MTYQSGPILRENQKQVLYGTILGGSSIIRPKRGKNFYLAMRDSNELWLSYKVDALNDFFKLDQSTIKKDKNTHRCYSVAYPVFNDLFDTFYDGDQKLVTKEILDILTDHAWMVWFVDSGRKSKRKAYLRTHKFGKEGTETIAEYFNSLDCFCDVHQCRGRYEIVFTNKGSHEFMKTIAPRIPDFLLKNFED